MATKYTPPRQSIGGQMIDVVFLLGLVFLALFVPLWLGFAGASRVRDLPAGVELQVAEDGTQTWTGLTWEAIGQNPTMQAQWEKLGYTVEGVADIVTQPFDYGQPDYQLDYVGIAFTGIVILGYFIFMLVVSEKEYKQVIAEKFD